MNKKQAAAIKGLIAPCSSEHPLTVLDVGASGGVQNRWDLFAKYLRVIGVEPDAKAHAELVKGAGPRDVFLNVALSKGIGTNVLHITRKQECSSFYHPNEKLLGHFHEAERFSVESKTTVSCSTLDAEFEKHKLGRVDFLKIDVQGSERDILLGGQEVVSSAFGVEVEVEFQPLYEGQPLFSDVDKVLREQGFELFDIARHFWRRTIGGRKGSYRGQLMWGDALYLRSLGSFMSALKEMETNEERVAILAKAIAICLLYGYPDYAKELVSAVRQDITEDVYKHLDKEVDQYISAMAWAPEIRGKTRVSIMLNRILEVMAFNGLNADDPRLGN